MTTKRTIKPRKNSRPKAAQARRRPGLFIVGTDTGVGKTYVACRIAETLVRQGIAVGVYKPAASGCRRRGAALVSTDAQLLWEAAGRPGEFSRVCPQCFAAQLAPHLAAREEGKQLDARLLRQGLDYWLEQGDLVIVEGAGGLMSPLGESEYVVDLARDLGFPLVVVAANRIGVINQTLQTLIAAEVHAAGLPVAGIVLNNVTAPKRTDPSAESNRGELEIRCAPPVLAQLPFGGKTFDWEVNWKKLAAATR